MKVLAFGTILVELLSGVGAVSLHGQGSFQNLNFEGAFSLPALNPPSSTALVPMANALPGWTQYINGTILETLVIYNGVSVGAAAISLLTSNTANSTFPVLGGNYTVAIAAGQFPPLTSTVPTAIAQTSLVPVTALSLRFSARGFVADLAVSFNGQEIPFFLLQALPNYGIYGCDVSTIRGLPGELRFTERPISNPFSKALLDDIFFSDQAIPEPSTFCLFGLGALFIGWQLSSKSRS